MLGPSLQKDTLTNANSLAEANQLAISALRAYFQMQTFIM